MRQKRFTLNFIKTSQCEIMYRFNHDTARNNWESARNELFRGLYIGGSEIGSVMGLNNYCSPNKLASEKLGLIKRTDNENMYWGRVHEATVAKEFERRTKIKCVRRYSIYRSLIVPYLVANVDRICNDASILECKTANAYKAKEWGASETNIIPPNYYAQIQHYMFVLGVDHAHVAVLIGGNEFRHYHFTRNDDFITEMLAKAEWFMGYLKEGKVPPVDDNKRDSEFLSEKFSDVKNTFIEANGEMLTIVNELDCVKSELQILTDKKTLLENKIKEYIGNNKGITRICTWTPYTYRKVDSNILKKEYPVIYDKVSQECSTRRLTFIKPKHATESEIEGL